MANQITFEKLFDKGSFSSGVTQLVELINKITVEIGNAEIAANALSSSLAQQLKKEINDLKANSANLTTELKSVNQRFDDFKQTVSNTTDVIKKYENENEKLKKQLTDLEKETKKYEQEQKKLNEAQQTGSISSKGLAQSFLGVASGAALLYKGISVLKDQLTLAFESAIDFQRAMKEVQAITRSSGEALSLLTKDANRLGSSTEKTSTQIASLQKELAKLGFTVTEILSSSSSIVDLSTATGEGLAQSATVAAATLRAFGLEAQEMVRVVDVMAGSFVRSGLDLEKFRESMKLVAPIARATNLDIELTTAALSKLADAGLSGSLAGTALRNLMSNLSSDSTKLGKRIGFAVENTEDFIRAFKKLRDEGVGLKEAIDLVDVRARPAFFTILNQIDAIERLNLEYRILDGEAKKIADTMRATLANDIEIANSAFDAFRRNLVEDTLPALSNLIKGLTTTGEFMRFLVSDVRTVSKAMDEGASSFTKLFKALTAPFTVFSATLDKLPSIGKIFKTTTEESKTTEFVKNLKTELKGVRETIVQAKEDIELLDSVTASLASGSFYVLNSEAVKLDERFKDILESTESQENKLKLIKGRLEDSVKEASNLDAQYKLKLQTAQKTFDVIDKIGKEEGFNLELTQKWLQARSEVTRITQLLLKTETERTAIQALINEYKEKGIALTEEELALMIQVAETEMMRNKEYLKTEEIRRKIAWERSKGQQDELDKLELYKNIRIAVIKAELDEEIDRINRTQEAEEILTVKREIAHEKFLQRKLNIENDFNNNVLKVIKETNDKIDQVDQKLFEARVERVQKLLKAYEDVNKMSADLPDKPPISEEAWRNVSSELDRFNKLGKRSLSDWIALRKEAMDLEKKGAEQNDSLNDKDMDRLLELKGELKEFENLTRRGIANALRETSRLTTMLFDNASIRRANELKAIDDWEQERIRMAGDNEEAINAIKEEAEEKRRQIKIRQAKADRTEALFQIAIQTAVNIVRAGLKPWEIALMVALGAAQAAIVAARPLPAFAKGTDNAPEGLAVVGERGRELIYDKRSGTTTLSPDRSTVMYLSKGSTVVPNSMTEQLLAQNNVDHNSLALRGAVNTKHAGSLGIDYDRLGSKFEQAVTKIPVIHNNFDEKGVKSFVMRGNNRTERLNRRYTY